MRRTGRKALPTIVWATAWVSFFADFSTELIYGLLPAFYLGTLTLGIVWLGVIEGLAETIVAMTKLFSGYLSDRTGRRKSWMLAGYCLSAAAKPMLVFATSGAGVGAFRALDRFGKGIRGAPRDALVAGEVESPYRGRAFGVLRGLDHAGALVGGLVAALLLATGLATMKQMFVLSAIPGFAAVLIIALFIRERKREQPVVRTHEPFSPRAAWRATSPAMRRYLLVAGVFSLANSSDLLLLALCYERFLDAGISQPRALGALPLLWAVLHVVRTLGSPLGGRLSDAIGRIPLITLAWLTYAVIYALGVLLALGAHPALAWLIFGAYGLHAALAEAPERALIADLQPDPERRGTAYGMLHFVTGLTALPAAALAGVLWQFIGPAVAFGVDASLALVGAILLRLLLPPSRLAST
jgi:MFS family permease